MKFTFMPIGIINLPLSWQTRKIWMDRFTLKNYIGVSVFLMIVLKVANIKRHNFVLLKIQQYSTVQYNTTLATGLAQHLFLHSRLPDYSY